MKMLFLAALGLVAFSSARADDIADAKAAFDTLLEYQKSDDPRSLDLFAKDVVATFTVTDGKADKSFALKGNEFRQWLTKELERKSGMKDKYEEVKYTPEGKGVRVTAQLLFMDTGKKAPFSLLYLRDPEGILRVQEMKVTIPMEAPAPSV